MSGIGLITDLLKIPASIIKREREPVEQRGADGAAFDDHLQDSQAADSANEAPTQTSDTNAPTDKAASKDASTGSGKTKSDDDDQSDTTTADDDKTASTVITAAQALPTPAATPLIGTPLLVTAQIETAAGTDAAAAGTDAASATPDAALLAAANTSAAAKLNADLAKAGTDASATAQASGDQSQQAATAAAGTSDTASVADATALVDATADAAAKPTPDAAATQKAATTDKTTAAADLSAALVETLKPAATDAQTTRLQAVNVSAVDKKITLAKGKDETATVVAQAPATNANAKADTQATPVQPKSDITVTSDTPQADTSTQQSDADQTVNAASTATVAAESAKAPAPPVLTTQTQTQQPTVVAQTIDAQTRAPLALARVPFEIAASAHRGEKQFQIRLDPAELGGIDVTVSVDKHGKVATHLVVERPETLDQLRRDQPNLERALSNSGLKTDSGAMQFSLKDQSGQSQQGQDQRTKTTHRGTMDINVEELNGWAARPVVASLSQGRGSGIDLHV